MVEGDTPMDKMFGTDTTAPPIGGQPDYHRFIR